MAGAWAGSKVTKARAHWKARLPLPCYLGGEPVDGTRPWVVEHIVPRSLGGGNEVSNQWVSCRTHSNSQGGQLGSAKVNAPKTVARVESEKDRGIRGL